MPICFFLLAFGMRVPPLADQSSPKPRPRAVVERSPSESSSKAFKAGSARSVQAVAVLPETQPLPIQQRVGALSPKESATFTSATPAPAGARGPPGSFC